MEKNLRESDDPTQQSPDRENWPSVCYLGFVVDSRLPPADTLTHALVNRDDAPNGWYVIELPAGRYPTDPTDSVPRYFRTVFVAAINALWRYKKEGELKQKTVIMEKSVPQYANMAAELRNLARRDKVKSVSPDFPKLRLAIHHSLFAAHGTKKKGLDIIWKGRSEPNAIFFWSPRSFNNLMLTLSASNPWQTAAIPGLRPQSELSPESLTELANSLTIHEYGRAWEDLYRKAIIASMRVHDFIEPSVASRADQDEASEQNQPSAAIPLDAQANPPRHVRQILQVLEGNDPVVLVGSSGSGKTTTLKHWAWQLANAGEKPGGGHIVPLLVPMKWFGVWPQREDPPRWASYVAFWVRETLDQTLTTSELRDCNLFSKEVSASQMQQLTRRELLSAVEKEVERMFSDEAVDCSGIALLLDGLNEMSEGSLRGIGSQISWLTKRVYKIVLTTRRGHPVPILAEAREFELCELSDDQISEYLEGTRRDNDHTCFAQLQKNLRILSMARNPFCSSLIAEKMKDEPSAGIAENRALLIKDFVHTSIGRKHEEDIGCPDSIQDSLLFTVLPIVAKWSLDSVTATQASRRTPFFQSSHFRSIQDSPAHVFEVLRLAERCGLLASAGLPAALHESKDYPEFVHDNVRDYFAALYLRGLEPSEFIQSLPDRLEHFAWDEPLLLFLELGVTEQALRRVVECVTPVDPVLASMCVRCAEGVGDSVILELERKIRKCEGYNARVECLPYGFDRNYPRSVHRPLPAHILSRLPVQYLLDLIRNPQEDGPPAHSVWFAIAENVSSDHLAILDQLWKSLTGDQLTNQFGIFRAICRIPTRSAFTEAANIYKQVRAEPEHYPSLAEFLEPPFLTIAYAPSLSEAFAEFPIEQHKYELYTIVDRVAHTGREDVPLLKKLLSSENAYSCGKPAELLVQVLGKDAIPVLLDRLTASLTSQGMSVHEHHHDLRRILFELIIGLDPRAAFEILVRHVKHNERYVGDAAEWEILAKTCEDEFVTHAITCVCQDAHLLPECVCIDHLQSWSVKQCVVDRFRDYADTHSPLAEREKLLGAALGLSELSSAAHRIFQECYSIVILDQRKPAPENPAVRRFYEADPDRFHEVDRVQAHRLLPLALRAVSVSMSRGDLDMLKGLLEWSYSHLADEGEHPEMLLVCSPTAINYEILTQCVRIVAEPR